MKDKRSTNSNTKARTVRATKTAATNKDFRDFQPSTGIFVPACAMQNRPSDIAMESDFHYLPDVVARDMSLPAPALKLYILLLDMSDIQTGETLPQFQQEISPYKKNLGGYHGVPFIIYMLCYNSFIKLTKVSEL